MKKITYNNKTLNMAGWSREFGVSRERVSYLVRTHPDIEPSLIIAHLDKDNEYKLDTSVEVIYKCICEYVEKHNYPPSIVDIVNNTDIKTKNTVYNGIKILLEKGLLETDEGCVKSRAYRVANYQGT